MVLSTMRSRDVGLLTRVQACGVARRTYPVAVGLALAELRAQRTWRDPAARETALTNMELLVGRTSRAHEVPQLARRYLYETYRYQELLWRTGLALRLPVSHLERLAAVVAEGRGVVLSVVHQGQFGAHGACIARHGFPLTALVAPALFGEQPATFRGVVRRQLFTQFSSGRGVTVLEATHSYDRLRALLLAGRTVLVGCDLKGSTPVEFLGRTVSVPSGTAKLALATGAAVVPVSVLRDGRLERLELQEPLRPEAYTDHRELLQAVFDRHAPQVLAWPEAMESPKIHFREVAPEGAPSLSGADGTGVRPG